MVPVPLVLFLIKAVHWHSGYYQDLTSVLFLFSCRVVMPPKRAVRKREKEKQNSPAVSDSDDDIPLCLTWKKKARESSPRPQRPPDFLNDPIVTNPRIKRQLEKVICSGCQEISFTSPVPQAYLEDQVELLIDAAIYYENVNSLELQVTSTPPTLYVCVH